MNPFKNLVLRSLHLGFQLTRGMTLGVRAACFDEAGAVFLVRHTYLPGWYLPGGGVERGETALVALIREIREEGNLEARTPPQLLQVFFNSPTSRRDHVLLYRLDVRQTAPRRPDLEIAESGFFRPDALPQDATEATRRRLAELATGGPYAEIW